jgi:hypothetical protein
MIVTILASVYVYSLLLFSLDSSLFFLCDDQPIYLLLAYLITTLFYRPSWPQLFLMLFLASLESFIYLNFFGSSLLYLIPATLLTLRLRDMFYASRMYPLILTLMCLIIQIYGIEWGLLGLETPLSYTIAKILGTLLLVGIFSLRIHVGHNKTTAYP